MQLNIIGWRIYVCVTFLLMIAGAGAAAAGANRILSKLRKGISTINEAKKLKMKTNVMNPMQVITYWLSEK